MSCFIIWPVYTYLKPCLTHAIACAIASTINQKRTGATNWIKRYRKKAYRYFFGRPSFINVALWSIQPSSFCLHLSSTFLLLPLVTSFYSKTTFDYRLDMPTPNSLYVVSISRLCFTWSTVASLESSLKPRSFPNHFCNGDGSNYLFYLIRLLAKT